MADVLRFQRPADAPLTNAERRQRIRIACQDAAGRAENPIVKQTWLHKASQACYVPTSELRPVLPAPLVDFTP